LSSSDLPTLSGRQLKRADTLAGERYGVPLDWLMEAAGWQIARQCDRATAVVCGVGNNGGDGLAAARHLQRWGRLTSVSCIDPSRLRDASVRELEALHKLGVDVSQQLRLDGADIVVDAILGTGLSGPPEGVFAEWIEAINGSGKHVIAVDIPSGLDAESGVALSPAVKADLTITFGLPKPGLMNLAGRVVAIDIGVPVEAYEAVGVHFPRDFFAAGDVVDLK
jgi:NAD(P)H-hydrate epimerase